MAAALGDVEVKSISGNRRGSNPENEVPRLRVHALVWRRDTRAAQTLEVSIDDDLDLAYFATCFACEYSS
jgi:hypothetical protein